MLTLLHSLGTFLIDLFKPRRRLVELWTKVGDGMKG
jgi:hypothetical protein